MEKKYFGQKTASWGHLNLERSIFFNWRTAFLCLLVLPISIYVARDTALADQIPTSADTGSRAAPQSANASPPPTTFGPGTVPAASQTDGQNSPSSILTAPASNNSQNNPNTITGTTDQNSSTQNPQTITSSSAANSNAPTDPGSASAQNTGLTMQELQQYQDSLAQPLNVPVQENTATPKPAATTATKQAAIKFSLPKPSVAEPLIRNAASSLWAPLVSSWATISQSQMYFHGGLSQKTTKLLYGVSVILFTGGILAVNKDAKKRSGKLPPLRQDITVNDLS